MRTQNIVYSTKAPGTPETFTGTLGIFNIQTTNINLTGSTGSFRCWPNGASPTAVPSANLLGTSYVNGRTGGIVELNLDNIETALLASASTEAVWHYSLFLTHSGNQVHVCSGYIVRLEV